MRSVLALSALVSFAGCTCNRTSSGVAGGEGGAASASAAVSRAQGPAIFSAPIAASHGAAGVVYFAGLVAARNVFELTKIQPDGSTAWSVDAVSDVHWSSDSDVRVFASPGGGAFVLGRGTRGGKLVREIVSVDASGKLRAPAEPMKSDACATADGIATLRESGEHATIVLRDFAGSPPRDLFSLHAAGDHELVCGDHAVFGVTHDDALTLERSGAAPVVLANDHDDAEDVEEVAAGDDFAAVSMHDDALSLRSVIGDKADAWKKIGKLPAGADIAVLDADARDLYVIYTEETHEGSCVGGGSPSKLSAMHVPRAGGDAHLHAFSTLTCDSDDGPFFTGFLRKNGTSRFVVAWPERRAPGSGEAPISALAYVTLDADKVSDVERLTLNADAITEAGCDDDACYAAALMRVEGTDGMVPGPAKILRYP
ncbi:MAG: hypothetical protein ACRELY_15335 [Polyangiaceae bacterium]